MTINSTTRKTNNLAGNGNTPTYPFAFKVFTDADVVVKKLEVSTSIETTLTLGANNDYIVTLNEDQNGNPGGSITLKSGGNNYNLPSGFQLVITSALEPLQGTDLTNQGGFYPEVINDALDKAVILHQQQQDEIDRSIKMSLTNTIGSLEITENANARKNRVLGFDNLGEFEVLKELGTYRGNWAASTAYAVRDLVKDTSTNNIFFCNTAHTSQGSQPLTTNANSANWDLIVDAATATTQANTATAQATAAANSATAAANSATAAATSATSAASSATTATTKATAADTAKTAAETAKTAAETAQTAAEAALDTFDDRYLGAKASDPTVDNDGNALIDGAIYWNTSSNVTKIYDLGNTSWDLLKLPSSDQTKVNTVAGISSDVTTVAGIASNVTTVAGNTTNINAVAGNNSNITSVANNSSNINSAVSNASNINAAVSNASNINAVAGNASNINTVAGNNSNISTVAGANSNITTVATNINNVNAIATDIAKIQTVANDLNETVSEIETAANDLNETTSEIDTVANAITNVDNVGNNIANVNTVAGIASNVTSVAGNATNVNTVAGAITNVNNVGGSIANVNTCATNLSGINSFAERYRTDNTGNNPSTSLNAGDLFYNQGSGKLLVYNGNTSAWEETQSVGNFFINTISSYSGTGGNSATFNGAAYKFTLSNAGQFAQQMLVSINGVVQKPNSGTGQPSEGFALDGANIVFSAAPPNGSDYFIVTIGASVSIGTPSNGTVTPASFVNGTSNNNGKFLRANNGAAPSFETVNTDLVGDTSPQLGGNLDTNGNNIVISDGEKLSLHTYVDVKTKTGATNAVVNGLTGHVTQNSLVLDADHDIWLATSGNKITFGSSDSATHEVMRVQCAAVGASQHGFVHLNYVTANAGGNASSATKLQTTSTGVTVTGTVAATAYTGDGSNLTGINTDLVSDTSPQLGADLDVNDFDIKNGNTVYEIVANTRHKFDCAGSTVMNINGGGVDFSVGHITHVDDMEVRFGSGNDLKIYHDGDHSYIKDTGTGQLRIWSNDLRIQDTSGNAGIQMLEGGAVYLYHSGSQKLETVSAGISVTGQVSSDTLHIADGSNGIKVGNSDDLKIYHDGSNNYLKGTQNQLIYIGTNNVDRWYFANDGHFRPEGNNIYDIGSSSQRVRNIYTNDLNLSNEGSSNDVDGTWGSYTIQEGAEDLFLVNRRNGKKYKFNLTEVS